MDIFLAVVFVVLIGLALSGSVLVIKDKQKAWEKRNLHK